MQLRFCIRANTLQAMRHGHKVLVGDERSIAKATYTLKPSAAGTVGQSSRVLGALFGGGKRRHFAKTITSLNATLAISRPQTFPRRSSRWRHPSAPPKILLCCKPVLFPRLNESNDQSRPNGDTPNLQNSLVTWTNNHQGWVTREEGQRFTCTMPPGLPLCKRFQKLLRRSVPHESTIAAALLFGFMNMALNMLVPCAHIGGGYSNRKIPAPTPLQAPLTSHLTSII